MIELIAAAVSGAVVGGGVVLLVAKNRTARWKADWLIDVDRIVKLYSTKPMETLTALRSNCFVTNERGHRVPYTKASVAARVKAETPRADKV